jgi:hypothetical protein
LKRSPGTIFAHHAFPGFYTSTQESNLLNNNQPFTNPKNLSLHYPTTFSATPITPMSARPWAAQMIEVRARSGWSTKVYEPLIRHRWPFYARDPSGAIAKLQLLPPNTIQAILEHLYANTPVARTNLPAFKNCKVVDSIPFESTYHRDMTAFLNDASTSDFTILPRDSEQGVPVHRFMLSARSEFFRRQFEANPGLAEFRDPNMGRAALLMFAGYLYTGKLEFLDAVAYVDLFGAGVNYKLRDVEEIDFLALSAIAKYLSPQNALEIRARATERGITKVLDLVNEHFPG